MNSQITLHRTFNAPLALVWDMWTTKEGIESWWGPPGFEVVVGKLELRVGGALEYVMTCVGAEQIAYMKQMGQPLSTALKARYTTVQPKTVAAWMNLVDFVPDTPAYEAGTRIELIEEARNRVRVELRIDAMHNEFFTNLAAQGWEGELGKLERALSQRTHS